MPSALLPSALVPWALVHRLQEQQQREASPWEILAWPERKTPVQMSQVQSPVQVRQVQSLVQVRRQVPVLQGSQLEPQEILHLVTLDQVSLGLLEWHLLEQGPVLQVFACFLGRLCPKVQQP